MLANNTSKSSISAIEISLVLNQGFWLLKENEDLFLAYADFPWFKEATIAQITNVERPSVDHIDLSVDSVRDPSNFPLISKIEGH